MLVLMPETVKGRSCKTAPSCDEAADCFKLLEAYARAAIAEPWRLAMYCLAVSTATAASRQ